jgi:hypothetical protein
MARRRVWIVFGITFLIVFAVLYIGDVASRSYPIAKHISQVLAAIIIAFALYFRTRRQART